MLLSDQKILGMLITLIYLSINILHFNCVSSLQITYYLMNKQSQKRVIEINHAFSGIYGEEIKTTAFRINESRKDILKKLQRKKKLASIIHDELYGYLEKFPEEKLGLNQQFVKKKKTKLSDFEERYLYKNPGIVNDTERFLTPGAIEQLKTMQNYFRYHLEISSQSEQSKNM